MRLITAFLFLLCIPSCWFPVASMHTVLSLARNASIYPNLHCFFHLHFVSVSIDLGVGFQALFIHIYYSLLFVLSCFSLYCLFLFVEFGCVMQFYFLYFFFIVWLIGGFCFLLFHFLCFHTRVCTWRLNGSSLLMLFIYLYIYLFACL